MRLIQVPEPRIPGAYTLSPNRQWHYLQPHVAKAWEYSCYSVAKKYEAGILGPVLFDCSDARGRTPHGRHPRGAHDAGVNWDASYVLTEARPDFVPGPHRGNRMTGPPAFLDSRRQAEWFIALARLDVATGSGLLIRMIAVDPFLEGPIDDFILQLGEIGYEEREAVRICFSNADPRYGWDKFHHNHNHARFSALTDSSSERISKFIESTFIAHLLEEGERVVTPRSVMTKESIRPELADQPKENTEPDPLPEEDFEEILKKWQSTPRRN